METHVRSITKSLTWRIFGLVFTFMIGWLVTGSMKLGLTLGLLDFFSKLGTFYLHERLWMKIRWGRLDGATVTDPGAGI
ncbi:MAG: DUF2061 domain-containing protein [bacterium]